MKKEEGKKLFNVSHTNCVCELWFWLHLLSVGYFTVDQFGGPFSNACCCWLWWCAFFSWFPFCARLILKLMHKIFTFILQTNVKQFKVKYYWVVGYFSKCFQWQIERVCWTLLVGFCLEFFLYKVNDHLLHIICKYIMLLSIKLWTFFFEFPGVVIHKMC